MKRAFVYVAMLGLAYGARAAEPEHDHGTAEAMPAASMHGHMNEDSLRAFALADRLEWRTDGTDALAWDVLGWIGTDANRLWLRSEAERARGITEDASVEALWGHPCPAGGTFSSACDATSIQANRTRGPRSASQGSHPTRSKRSSLLTSTSTAPRCCRWSWSTSCC